MIALSAACSPTPQCSGDVPLQNGAVLAGRHAIPGIRGGAPPLHCSPETAAPTPEADTTAREVLRLKRAVFGLREDLDRQRALLGLLRTDLASIYGLVRLLVEREQAKRGE